MNSPLPSFGETIYTNPLACERDIASFHLEGQASLTFPNGRLRMENALDSSLGQASNFVLWCGEVFPDHVCFSWDFWPVREPGLCMFFFSAQGRNGADILDPALAPRNGIYKQYYDGDINTLHLSYFRRKHPTERAFSTCNLRKSHGFHLVAQGADPIPTVVDALPPYRIQLWKTGSRVAFCIGHQDEEVRTVDWIDDGTSWGTVLTGGRAGFRQMAPLIGEYANFTVRRVGE